MADWPAVPPSIPNGYVTSLMIADSTIIDADISTGAGIAEAKLVLASDAIAAVPSRRTLGTGPFQAAAGNDPRFNTINTNGIGIDARDFGVTANGVTDDTVSIQSAITAAITAGSGVVHMPAGVIIAAGIIARQGVILRGQGRLVTIIRLKAGSTTDLVVTENFATLTGGVTRNGPDNFGFEDMTLDGNKANVTSGWICRLYGDRYHVMNVDFINGKTGGVWSESGTGGSDFIAFWTNFRIKNCDGNSLEWRGPNDSMFTNGEIFRDGSNGTYAGIGILTDGNATSELFNQVHVWGRYAANRGWNFKRTAYCTNCVSDGVGITCDVNIGSWIGGTIFGENTANQILIQMGDTTTARYWQFLGTRLGNMAATAKPVHFQASDKNSIQVLIEQAAGTPTDGWSGTPGTFDEYEFRTPNNPALGATWSKRITYGQQQFYRDASTRGMLIVNNGSGQSFLQIRESTSLPNASTDCANVMTQDNGSGKTQLVVRFATGATIVLATEV